jgi:hypothetical protein
MSHASMIPPSRKPISFSDSPSKNLRTETKRYMKQKVNQHKRNLALVLGAGLARHAAQSQITGSAGIALRTGGRIAIRAIPMVGVALAVYSIWEALN